MPNTKSAKKRLRQSIGRRVRNRSTKSLLKNQVRKTRQAIAAGDLEKGAAELAATARKLDQASGKKVIHANAAARVKSRLSAALKAAKQKTPAKA